MTAVAGLLFLFFPSLLQQLWRCSDWRRRRQNNRRRHIRRWGRATCVSHFTFCQRALRPARLVSERRLSFASSGLFGGDSPPVTWDNHLSEPILRPVSYPPPCEYRATRDTCSRWDSAASGGDTLKDNCLFCVSWTLKKTKREINHQRSECLTFSDCLSFHLPDKSSIWCAGICILSNSSISLNFWFVPKLISWILENKEPGQLLENVYLHV